MTFWQLTQTSYAPLSLRVRCNLVSLLYSPNFTEQNVNNNNIVTCLV